MLVPEEKLKPMFLKESSAYFGGFMLLVAISFYGGIPLFKAIGLDPITAYLMANLIPMVIMFAVSLKLRQMEGIKLSFKKRFRYKKMGATHPHEHNIQKFEGAQILS